jgi:uncharacterized protein (TIGR00369 family)
MENKMSRTHDLADRIPRPVYAALLNTEFQGEDPETKRITVAYEGRPEFCNPAGFIQGGFLATMLDDSMGLAVIVNSKAQFYPSTINMNVTFVGPTRPGRLTVEATVVKIGKTIGFVRGELRDAEGVPVAHATCSVRLTPMPAAVPGP